MFAHLFYLSSMANFRDTLNLNRSSFSFFSGNEKLQYLAEELQVEGHTGRMRKIFHANYGARRSVLQFQLLSFSGHNPAGQV